jgi:hypothetical protein
LSHATPAKKRKQVKCGNLLTKLQRFSCYACFLYHLYRMSRRMQVYTDALLVGQWVFEECSAGIVGCGGCLNSQNFIGPKLPDTDNINLFKALL